MSNYFIYRHIRRDTNQVFYVGRGKIYSRSHPHRRAYDVKRRNAWWCRVVDKNDGKFDVEIVFWSDDRGVILDKEKEFIALYGRRVNGGTLVNMTDGGDGSLGMKHSVETKKRLREQRKQESWRGELFRSDTFKAIRMARMANVPGPMRGKRASSETRHKQSLAHTGARHPGAKRVINSVTGHIFGCVGDAALWAHLGKWTLYKQLSGARKNTTALRYV